MKQTVVLRYPNGRLVELMLDAPVRPGTGYEFVAHGRRWRVIDPPRASRRRDARLQTERIECECVGNEVQTAL